MGIVRDPRLRRLSSDHHHALVLALDARRASDAGTETVADGWDRVLAAFSRDLDPHFAVEESILLPALEAAGQAPLAERTRREHAQLRALAASRAEDPRARLASFAALLEAHVRFEERELFEAAQRSLAPSVLEAVAAARV
jgi:hypothetical protein